MCSAGELLDTLPPGVDEAVAISKVSSGTSCHAHRPKLWRSLYEGWLADSRMPHACNAASQSVAMLQSAMCSVACWSTCAEGQGSMFPLPHRKTAACLGTNVTVLSDHV